MLDGRLQIGRVFGDRPALLEGRAAFEKMLALRSNLSRGDVFAVEDRITRAIVGAYEIDFRIVIGEEIRWISARASASAARLSSAHSTQQ